MISIERSTMQTTFALGRTCAIAAILLASGCPSDDTVPEDGSGSGGATVGPSTGSGSTQGATSTSSASGSGTEPSSASSTDSTAADSTGTPPADACACAPSFPARDFCHVEDLAGWVPGCPQEQPCSRVTVSCPRPNQDLYDCSSELVFDETAMQCVLETLRDGTPGQLVIDGLLDYGIRSGQSLYVVHVLEGRMAIHAGCIDFDFGHETYEPAMHALADPGYFTDCMAVEAPRERYECMMDGLGEGTALPACPG